MTAKLILPLLSLFVFYAIFYYADINNLRSLAEKSIESKTLPNFAAPLRTEYTGQPKIDELLTVLTTFFWPATDGSNPSLTAHSIGFSGVFGSSWVLVTLESWRRGNAWTLAAFPMVLGLSAQVLTFAFATPLYCAIQLFTSITVQKPTAERLRVPRAVLNAIPLVFTIGYIVPSTLMILPLSEHITPDLKQIFIALWQPWPAYTSILLVIVNLVASPFVSNDNNPANNRATLRALRQVYAFAFFNAAFTHIISWTISLATVAAPTIFQEKFLAPLHPFKVFEVPQPWASPVVPVTTVGEGVHAFLRWDYLIGSAGILIWAISLYKSAHRIVYGRVEGLDLLGKVAFLTVVSGPAGAAVELMWERDELVVKESKGVSKEKKGM